MTYDVTKPITEERYRLTIVGFGTTPKRIRFYDPLTDKTVAVKVTRRESGKLVVEVSVTDYPRLLEVWL